MENYTERKIWEDAFHPSLWFLSVALLTKTLLLTCLLTLCISVCLSTVGSPTKKTYYFIFSFTRAGFQPLVNASSSLFLVFLFFICSFCLSIPAWFSASHCNCFPTAFPLFEFFFVYFVSFYIVVVRAHTHICMQEKGTDYTHTAVRLLGWEKDFHIEGDNSENNTWKFSNWRQWRV